MVIYRVGADGGRSGFGSPANQRYATRLTLMMKTQAVQTDGTSLPQAHPANEAHARLLRSSRWMSRPLVSNEGCMSLEVAGGLARRPGVSARRHRKVDDAAAAALPDADAGHQRLPRGRAGRHIVDVRIRVLMLEPHGCGCRQTGPLWRLRHFSLRSLQRTAGCGGCSSLHRC